MSRDFLFEWKSYSPRQNEANKEWIEGYFRLLRSGKEKIYRRAEHPYPQKPR